MEEGPFAAIFGYIRGKRGLEDTFSVFGSLHFVALQEGTWVSHALLVVKVVSTYSNFGSAAWKLLWKSSTLSILQNMFKHRAVVAFVEQRLFHQRRHSWSCVTFDGVTTAYFWLSFLSTHWEIQLWGQKTNILKLKLTAWKKMEHTLQSNKITLLQGCTFKTLSLTLSTNFFMSPCLFLSQRNISAALSFRLFFIILQEICYWVTYKYLPMVFYWRSHFTTNSH